MCAATWGCVQCPPANVAVFGFPEPACSWRCYLKVRLSRRPALPFILKRPRALRVPPCKAVCVGFHARHFQLLLEHKGFFSVGPTTSVGLTPILATIPYQPTPRPIFRLSLFLCFPAHVKLYSCNSK